MLDRALEYLKLEKGPLTFFINIDKLILYADDSTILFSHKDPEFISAKLGKVLKDVLSGW